MRVCVVSTAAGPAAAILVDGRLVGAEREVAQIALGGASVAEPGADLGPLSTAALLAPVRPRKVVAVGLNYRDHIAEAGFDTPMRPLLFAKFPSSIVGPLDPIVIDTSLTDRVDWEVELAVVVGRAMRDVGADDALSHVFGYTVANDVSARDLQFADGQWVRAKSLDSFCPVGPWVVTADEVPDPQALRLTTTVNGEVVQDASSAEMVFGVADILSYCSQSFTLEPGDLVLTGTPWGCGEFMNPQRSLEPGDEVAVAIDGIGRMSNAVTAREAVLV